MILVSTAAPFIIVRCKLPRCSEGNFAAQTFFQFVIQNQSSCLRFPRIYHSDKIFVAFSRAFSVVISAASCLFE